MKFGILSGFPSTHITEVLFVFLVELTNLPKSFLRLNFDLLEDDDETVVFETMGLDSDSEPCSGKKLLTSGPVVES